MMDLSILSVMEIIRHKIFTTARKIAKSTKASRRLMVCSIIKTHGSESRDQVK